jgi:hypothetical protein
MNDTQLLERLGAAYETLDAPAPSAALAALMDAGGVASHEGDDDRRDAVVVPFARPRSRMRMRYLVAALVASFVAVSGLAAAGALPDSLQRQVSSVVSHLGVDLPSPEPSHDNAPPHAPSGTNGSGRPSSPTSTTIAADDPAGRPGAAGTTVPGSAPTTVAAVPSLGDVGAVDGGTTPTTLPSSGDLGLPPITVPVISLPPISLPPISLPPISLPPLLPLPLPPLPILGL